MIRILQITVLIFAVALPGCGRRDNVANASETAASAAAAAGPKVSAAAAKPEGVDAIKHQVMAFDLEGLADDGTKKWDVKGKSAEAVTENQVKLNDITASSYGPDAQATITADNGLYDKSKNSVRLEQNVKATIENTQKGASEFLSVPATAQPAKPEDAKSKKSKTVITCEAEVEFNYDKNEAYFNKAVHVVNDEGTIDADRITIHLEPSTKKIQTIVATGNVKIQRGENTTYSDTATYIEAEKRIVLSGRPKIVMYREPGQGDDIFDMKLEDK